VDEAPLAALERRVGEELAAIDPDPRAEARRVALLELEVLERLGSLRERDAERGNPVLADCCAWRDLSERVEAPHAAQAADDLAARLIEDDAAAWAQATLAGLAPEDPRAWFRALAGARELDLEALGRRRMEPPTAAFRARLRGGFLAAIAAAPPTSALRDDWVRELLDRGEAVLTSLDELEPDRACALLDLVGRDLTWHLVKVERHGGTRRRRLKRRRARLLAERQERELQARLESRFTTRRVARFERLILWLIFFVLALFAFELIASPGPGGLAWLILLDSTACLVFLAEIAIKLRYVRGRWRWFLRHFAIDVLPSIPFGLFLPPQATVAHAGRVLRLFRIGRLGRYVRVLRPVIRIVRAFGFLLRGTDRIVRRHGHLLNRDVVLYPTREESARIAARREGRGARLRRLHAAINEHWKRVLATAAPDRRETVAAIRIEELARAREAGRLPLFARTGPVFAESGRDLAAEELLRHLALLTPEEVESEMGPDDTARFARAVRVFSRLRWLPVLHAYTPRVAPGASDAATVASAAHTVSKRLKRHLDRWLWFADLYGTITPAQFLDRVGRAMVKASFRPAYRLTLFGILFLVLRFLLGISGEEGTFVRQIEELVRGFLLVLGSICFGVLGLGWWLRRIAGQATEFFERAAKAQYLALTESIKGRFIDRDAGILDRRIFQPERLVRGEAAAPADRTAFEQSVRRWLIQAQAAPSGPAFDPIESVVLLYRDGIDGALLADSDTRTTIQLLANPALRNLRILSDRITRKESRTMRRLDLERQKSLLGGPHLWFSLLCQAVEHGVARLIVDYNLYAIPRDQLAGCSEAERVSLDRWLKATKLSDAPEKRLLYVTTHFTALHFLDDDPRRDAEVADRFGDKVLARLKRDRRHLFRRTFGTYPLHKLPRERRALNLYRAYQGWIAGGRALLLPLRPIQAAVRFGGRFLRWLVRCIHEIKRPTFQVDVEAVEGSDYRAARRKIRRMRGPVAEAALRMRARFDPEYVGARLPGTARSGLEGAGLDEDLRFIEAGPELLRDMAAERVRAAADMARLGAEIGAGLFERLARRTRTDPSAYGRKHLRAAACAYLADFRGVRRNLSAREILREVYARAAHEEPRPGSLAPRMKLRRAFRNYWRQHGEGGPARRRAAWRATLHDVWGSSDALLAWAELGEEGRGTAEAAFADLLRHPDRMSEQLVILRAVQSLTLIDILNYRAHIFRLGDYARSGDDPETSLQLTGAP